jgi:hypothetical protein
MATREIEARNELVIPNQSSHTSRPQSTGRGLNLDELCSLLKENAFEKLDIGIVI